MAQVSIREVRSNLRALMERVEAGEEIVIVRRGRGVARLVPLAQEPRRFPDLTAFRASHRLSGEFLSETVIRQRRDARY